MSQTQQIIVYRSESEQVMDQFVMNGGPVPIIFGAVAAIVVFCLLAKGEQLYHRNRRHYRMTKSPRVLPLDFTPLFLLASGAIGVLVGYLTW